MKKAFMLVAAIALLAAPVFAEVEVTISGEATTSFGYNLDTEVYGLDSSVGSDIEIAIGALDGESMGEGSWYGVITLEGAGLSFNSAIDDEDLVIAVYEFTEDPDTYTLDGYEKMSLTTPDVTAKITDGNIYVQLQSEADFDADYVDDEDLDEQAYEFDEPAVVAGSLTVGGTFAPVEVAVEFATASSYEDAAQVDGVVLGANLGVDVAPLEIDFAFAGAFGYAVDQEIGFAFKVKADVAPLTITAAFDGLINDGLTADFLYEAGLDVDVDLDPLTVGVQAYFTEDNLDAKLTVGFSNDLLTTADVYFGIYDIMAATDVRWETGVDVTIEPNSGIKANAGFSFNSDSVITAYADVAFDELIDNVTFKLGWEDADDLTDEDATEASDMGQIYLSAGISF